MKLIDFHCHLNNNIHEAIKEKDIIYINNPQNEEELDIHESISNHNLLLTL